MGARRDIGVAKKLAVEAAGESREGSLEAAPAQPAGKRQRLDGSGRGAPVAGCSGDEAKEEGGGSDGDSSEARAGGQGPPLKSEKGAYLKCECCGGSYLRLAWPSSVAFWLCCACFRFSRAEGQPRTANC
jgi:hypothetical protein